MWKRKPVSMRSFFVLLVLIGLNGIGLSAEGTSKRASVIHCPNQTGPLEARWQWAMEQIPKQPATKPVWIGFSIERLMSENSFIGRWPVDPDYPTLSELIYNVRVEWPERSSSRYQASHKVVKEVAYLFEIDRASKSIGRIQTSNLSLTVYMKRGVLFWLGKVGYEQSLSLLRKLYKDTDDDYMKIRLMGCIGDLHHPEALPFLNDVLQNETSERVRKEAVDELDQYHSQESLDILLRTVRHDPSDAVRKQAVQRIGHIELSAAENALIEIAKTGPSPNVRREAIDELRDIASPHVMNCMVSIIHQDKHVEIQREALEALAQMENEKAQDMLIQVVKTHASPRIRCEAIDELERYGSPKIITCLESIINNPNELEKIQRTALDRLADYEIKEASDALIRIAQAHANPRIRLEAIDTLSDRISSEAVDCLNQIVNKQGEFHKIQREALETLARIEEDKALELLVQIAQTHADPRIRREGIDQLRDIDELRLSAFPKAVDCLVSIVNQKDELEENQREALDAIADIENNRATDELIRIAGTHINPRIREEAIDRLSDMDELKLSTTPKVIKCFESIIDNQEQPEKIQRKALDALLDIERQDVRAYIQKIATNHPKQKIRREAQEAVAEWIRDS